MFTHAGYNWLPVEGAVTGALVLPPSHLSVQEVLVCDRHVIKMKEILNPQCHKSAATLLLHKLEHYCM